MSDKQFWVYILKCDNGHYYTGFTTDLARRYQEHVTGKAKCKYTRSFKPVSLEKAWPFRTKADALRIERAIKKLPKAVKQQLILFADCIEEFISS
jgi:putative endonuclease